MDEIEELKVSLGPLANEYNDTQLRHLSRELDLAAEFLLDLYLWRYSERGSSKFDVLTPPAPSPSMRERSRKN